MSKRQDKHTRIPLSEQVRRTILGTMETDLPLGIRGRNLDDEQAWDNLMYASVNGTTIETACNELADTPSGNTAREHLGSVLELTRETVVGLDEQLTQALQSKMPKGLFSVWIRRPMKLARTRRKFPTTVNPKKMKMRSVVGRPSQAPSIFTPIPRYRSSIIRQRYELALPFV